MSSMGVGPIIRDKATVNAHDYAFARTKSPRWTQRQHPNDLLKDNVYTHHPLSNRLGAQTILHQWQVDSHGFLANNHEVRSVGNHTNRSLYPPAQHCGYL